MFSEWSFSSHHKKTCFSAACYSSGLYVTSPNVTHCYSVLSLPGSVMCFFKGFHELSYLYQNSYFFKARYVFPAVTHYDKIVVAGQACKSFLFTQLNICNQKLIKLGVHCIKGPAVDLNLISYLCLFSSAIHTRTSKQYQKLFLMFPAEYISWKKTQPLVSSCWCKQKSNCKKAKGSGFLNKLPTRLFTSAVTFAVACE